jgi:hypothetical protein
VSTRLFLLAALTLHLSAAGLTGIWTGQLPDGTQDISFRFTQIGANLTGKFYTDNESIPLKNVKIEGDRIAFTVTVELNGQFNVFTYTGIVHASEIEFTRTRESGRKEDKPFPKQTLVLRRLT